MCVLRLNVTARKLCTSKVHFCIALKESCYLVPGDTFLLGRKRFCLSCDAVLIDGSWEWRDVLRCSIGDRNAKVL